MDEVWWEGGEIKGELTRAGTPSLEILMMVSGMPSGQLAAVPDRHAEAETVLR